MKTKSLAELPDNKIKELIDAMRRGLEVVKEDSEEGIIMQTSIYRALEELKRRGGQKKTENQPTESVELNQKAEGFPKNNGWVGIPVPPQKREEKPEPVLISTDVLTKVPPPTIAVRWANGEIREMTELELRRKAVDYFGDVLDSNFNALNFYRSAQFNNCVRFLIGLYRFGNDLLPHFILHPTFNKCADGKRVKSAELYEYIKISWEEHKDSLNFNLRKMEEQ
jgi:hypothetical protein